ncbi:DUF4209 domain-containing protein [Flavobacterium notoginsengisoli]|uniref:DUF4209 domain-containing protein n=1 Tax=Flavobacterium notoginsengisoli TaxID=1478199 RepID=UPI00362A945E
MKRPEEVTAFFNSLENIKSLNVWNITKELSDCDKIKTTAWRKKIIIERKVLFHNLNDGQLCSNAQSTNNRGRSDKTLLFSKTDISYIITRLNETSNVWLKSRYSHILWQETKNNNYAEIAIQNYMESINLIKAKESRELDIILEAIFFISKSTKRKQEEAKKITLDLIEGVPNYFKTVILNSILKHNFLKHIELNSIADKILDWVDEKSPVAYFNNKKTLEVALILFDKVKRPNERIYELLAENEDEIIAQHDDESFVKSTALAEKAKYLKRAKKEEEYNVVQLEYTRLKQKIKLNKISVPLDDDLNEIFNIYLRAKSDSILEHPTEEILAFLSINEEILVDPKNISEQANQKINNSLYGLCSTSIFDINGNTKKLNDKEKFDFEKLNLYVVAHNIQVSVLFLRVFIDGVIYGKLNYYKTFEFLEKHSWYGMKFRKSLKNDEEEANSSWLSLLAPGIHNFLSQFELSILMNTNKISNFILCIDSMTIKFEGALRDFIRLSGGSTTGERKGETQEHLLEELLENPITKEYFSEKDIELFKFTFTKKGKNIRNNVAHSFMEYSDYSLQTASLVFFCILRLGKYTFEKQI